jgi:hypothetical protein
MFPFLAPQGGSIMTNKFCKVLLAVGLAVFALTPAMYVGLKPDPYKPGATVAAAVVKADPKVGLTG